MRNGEVLMMQSAAVCLTSAVCQSAAVRQSVSPTKLIVTIQMLSVCLSDRRRRECDDV